MIQLLLRPLLSRSSLVRPQAAFSGDSEAPCSQQLIFIVVCGVFTCSYGGYIIIFGSNLNNLSVISVSNSTVYLVSMYSVLGLHLKS